MKNTTIITIAMYLLLAHNQVTTLNAQQKKLNLKPPKPLPERVVVDEYHGIKVEDPYRYMENLEDPEVLEWMHANADYANAVLNQIPGKKAVMDQFMGHLNRIGEEVSAIRVMQNGTYFYQKQSSTQEMPLLYGRDCYTCKENLILDPATYKSNDSLNYAIDGYRPNFTGDKVAVMVAPNGSETPDLLILDNRGNIIEDDLPMAWEMRWLPNNDGFLYLKLDSKDVNDTQRALDTEVYHHALGDNPSKDKLFLSRKNNPEFHFKPEEFPNATYNTDANKFVINAYTVDRRLKTHLVDYTLKTPLKEQPLTKRDDNVKIIGLTSTDIYFLSGKDAPNYRILKTSMKNPNVSNAEIVIPEYEDKIITDLTVTADGLYYTTMKNAVQASVYFLANGSDSPKELTLPFAAGNADLQRVNAKSSDLWITISGWASPERRYKYNAQTNLFTYEPLAIDTEYPELKDLVVKEVMVTSHNNVKVPVTIIHHKNLKLNGKTSALIYGYGAYGHKSPPIFSPINIIMPTFNTIMVFAHVRGGGELGDAWHKAGQKLNKPNTWKDAIATAEYLVTNGYTNPEKLGIWSGSAGGILVGRAITDRPDLFKVAMPMVGSMNTVRSETTSFGPMNIPEFGTVKNPKEFKGLLEMDSYLHLEEGVNYPAMLITAGINDPRVSAWEPAKFAARIQALHQDNEPILFITKFDEGHGRGSTTSQMLEDIANLFTFFLWQTGHPEFQPKN